MGNFITQQREWGGAPELALVFLLLVPLAYLAFFAVLSFYPKMVLAGPGNWRRPGIILLGLMAIRLLAYTFITPPLQGPDAPGHFGRVLAAATGQPASSFNGQIAGLMEQTRFTDFMPWLTDKDWPIELYPATAEDYQPGLYYEIIGLAVKAGNLFNLNLTGQWYLACLVSGLFLLGTLAITLVAARQFWPEGAGIARFLPIALAFLPQPAFGGAIINNDSAVIFFDALATLGMLLLFKRGPNWRYFLLVLFGLTLGILSKRTGLTVIPGFGLGLLVFFWLRTGRTGRRLILVVSGGLLLVGLVVLVAITDFDKAVKGWYVTPFAGGAHPTATTQGLLLAGPQASVEQAVDLFFEKEPGEVELVILGAPAGEEASLTVSVSARDKEIGRQSFRVQAGQENCFRLTVPPGIAGDRQQPYLLLRLSATGGPVLVKTVRLYPLADPEHNLVANPDFSQKTLSPRSDWRDGQQSRHMRSTLADWLDLAGQGGALNYPQATLHSLIYLFISWWGAFGWIQVTLSPLWYIFWGLVTLAAGVGLLRGLISHRRTGWQLGFGLFCFLTFWLAIATQQAYIFFSWAYRGFPDVLAGRYSFVALLPALVLLIGGLRGLKKDFNSPGRNRDIIASSSTRDVSQTSERIINHTGKVTRKPKISAGLWGGILILIVYDLMALLGTIFSFYYNTR